MYAMLRPPKFLRRDVASNKASETRDRHMPPPGQKSLLSYLGSEEEAQPVSPPAVAVRHTTTVPAAWPEISTGMVFGWLWAGKWLIILFVILGAAAGFGFGKFSKPRFTVGSQIFIDPTSLRVVADDIFASNNQLDMQIYDVESKLRILTSSNVLNSVIDALRLDQDQEFSDSTSSDSQSAPKALEIANSIITNFQDELVKAQADGAGRAATELFARLDTLKNEVASADEAVQKFKRENNILSSSGELVSSIVANQTNTQLVDAQARVIRARSRYQELSTGSTESRLDSASIESQTMTALRTQYTLARRELDAQSTVFGTRHPRIAAMRPQLDAIQNQIAAEQSRILTAAKSELAQAEAALMAQQNQANTMKSVVFGDNDALVQLRQLEREAESRATIYQAFMARAKEIAERQQINTTNVRVISPPTIPKTRSYPPRNLYLAVGGLFAGFVFGCALALGLGLLHLLNRRSDEERRA